MKEFTRCSMLVRWLAGGLGFLAALPVSGAEPSELLVLHAYHQGFEWTDRMHEGLLLALDGMPVEVRVEYLDTKRFPAQEHLDAVASVLARKYEHLVFDAVAAFDDNAVDFALRHRDALWPGTPVIFGGLNSYEPNSLDHVVDLTGVAETVDLRGTLTLALSLVPAATRVLVLSDTTRTSSSVAQRLERVAAEFSDRVRFEFLTARSLREASAALEGLPKDAIVVLLTFTRDEDDRFIEYREAARKVTTRAQVPVFSYWDFYLGHGIVGGHLTSPHSMGLETGRSVRRVLEGESASDVPILEESPTLKQVDYHALLRHGIPISRVPAGTDVVGMPPRTVPVDRTVVLWAGVGATGMTFAVLYLGSNVLRRRRAEEKLLQHQHALERALANERLLAEIAALLNATDDFKVVLDRILTRLSERLDVARISLYSFSEEHAVGAKISSRLSERGKNIQDLDVLSFRRVRGVFEKIRHNQRVVSSDLAELESDERAYYLSRNIRAIVILPIQVAERVKGVLGFSQEVEHRWADDEVAVFETLAGMIAAAWERYEEMQARIEMEGKHADALQALEKSSRMAAVGVMAAGITHEINQPLNAIRVTTEGALRGAARSSPQWPDRMVNKLRTVSKAVNRIDRIIRHVREFWIDRGRENRWVVDVRDAVDRAFQLVGWQARNRRIEVTFETCEVPLLVRANPVQLEQIVINLVVNAIQALGDAQDGTRYGGRIVVSTRAEEGVALLEVADDGPGVPEEDVARLFDPFFSTKAARDGTGLGLAIVKNLVDSFDGEIEYRRNEMAGATFRLQFPRHEIGRGAA